MNWGDAERPKGADAAKLILDEIGREFSEQFITPVEDVGRIIVTFDDPRRIPYREDVTNLINPPKITPDDPYFFDGGLTADEAERMRMDIEDSHLPPITDYGNFSALVLPLKLRDLAPEANDRRPGHAVRELKKAAQCLGIDDAHITAVMTKKSDRSFPDNEWLLRVACRNEDLPKLQHMAAMIGEAQNAERSPKR